MAASRAYRSKHPTHSSLFRTSRWNRRNRSPTAQTPAYSSPMLTKSTTCINSMTPALFPKTIWINSSCPLPMHSISSPKKSICSKIILTFSGIMKPPLAGTSENSSSWYPLKICTCSTLTPNTSAKKQCLMGRENSIPKMNSCLDHRLKDIGNP